MMDESRQKAGELTRFQPGTSGNPDGLPKGTLHQRTILKRLETMLEVEVEPDDFLSPEVARKIRALFPDAGKMQIADLVAARLISIALLAENKLAIRAIKEIQDRTGGMATRTVQVNNTQNDYVVFEMMVDKEPGESGDDDEDIIDVTPEDDDGQEITLEP